MKWLKEVLAQETAFILACPALLWQTLFLYLPLAILLFYSLVDCQTHTFTLYYYLQILKSSYFKVILHSFIMAFSTGLITLMIAFPVACFLSFKVSERFRTFLLFSLILPSWTSLIVQIYAWFFLFNRQSFLSQILYRIGILPADVGLLNSPFAIMVGMVAVYLPFMILPLFAVMEKIDKTVLEASADLGANRYETLKRVIFPLSLPGIYSGFLLVFIPAFGEFAIPTLLGGSKIVLWGNLIVEKFLLSRDWQSGGAFVCFGILFPALIVGVIYVLSRIFVLVRTIKKVRQEQHKDVW